MILVDVNVLVYAARREFADHAAAATWVTKAQVGPEPVVVLDEVLAATEADIAVLDPLPAML